MRALLLSALLCLTTSAYAATSDFTGTVSSVCGNRPVTCPVTPLQIQVGDTFTGSFSFNERTLKPTSFTVDFPTYTFSATNLHLQKLSDNYSDYFYIIGQIIDGFTMTITLHAK